VSPALSVRRRARVARVLSRHEGPTLAKVRAEARQIHRLRVHSDVLQTLRALEHARSRWLAGGELAPETLCAIFSSMVGVLDEVSHVLVEDMMAEEQEERRDADRCR